MAVLPPSSSRHSSTNEAAQSARATAPPVCRDCRQNRRLHIGKAVGSIVSLSLGVGEAQSLLLIQIAEPVGIQVLQVVRDPLLPVRAVRPAADLRLRTCVYRVDRPAVVSALACVVPNENLRLVHGNRTRCLLERAVMSIGARAMRVYLKVAAGRLFGLWIFALYQLFA
ncbi:MAG: hypothetical protein JWM36_3888 [Hyphomicrobiales bacterium]|nr:hypothetical protein [Hyphomicrobiales bacterium]